MMIAFYVGGLPKLSNARNSHRNAMVFINYHGGFGHHLVGCATWFFPGID